MNKLADKYDDVVFIMINTRGVEDAEEYKESHGLSSENLLHGSFGSQPPEEYAFKYIPHKTIIGKDGTVIKNFDGVNLPVDVPTYK